MEKSEKKGSLPYFLKDNMKTVERVKMGKTASELDAEKERLNDEQRRINAATDKQRLREFQSDARRKLCEEDDVVVNNSDIYTKHLYFGNKDKKAVIAHCFNALEVNAASKLCDILPNLKGGVYAPIDMNRANYKAKIKSGVIHFVKYDIEIDGVKYKLKCKVVKKKEWKHVIEYPYTLKENRS